MKPYIKPLLVSLSLIILFSFQLYVMSHEEQTQFNITLITYVYVLLTNCSTTTLTVLALMLDALTFMITGVVGITILFLVPLSWIALKIKNDMYNKVVVPACFIFFYAIFYNIVLAVGLPQSLNDISTIKKISLIITHITWATLQNYLFFLVIWKTCKQPFHD